MQQTRSRQLLPIVIIVLFLAAAAVVVLIVLFRTFPISAITGGIPRQDVPRASTLIPSPQGQAEGEATPSPGDCMQATLTVLEGNVVLRRAGEDSFSPVSRSVWVGCGDVIRTGDNGSAQLIFFNDTETTIFPNSELILSNFTRGDDGSFVIRMEQAIGRLFHRINFTNPNSTHEVVTPHGVAAVRGTAYWSVIHVEGDVDSFRCVIGEISVTASVSDTNEAITCPSVTIDIGAGGVITTRELDLYCGDGLCDPYMNETEATCPDDC